MFPDLISGSPSAGTNDKTGKALKGRGGLSLGHSVINWAARENTWLNERGVSKGCGKGACLLAARM